MNFDDAVAAIEAAVEGEGAADTQSLFAPAPATPDQAPVTSAPQEVVEPSAAAPQTPAEPVAPVEAQPAEDSLFGNINPDQLPPELQPLAKQLQGAFTRKTQEVAEQRKQLETQFGDLNSVAEAVQLYQQLQDPRNWPRFAEEINGLMEQNGLRPNTQPAPGAPAPAPVTPQTSEVSAQLAGLAQQYPELAPIAGAFSALVTQLANQATALEQQRNQMALEMRQQAQAGEFARQEGVLKSEGVSDKEMEKVYTLSTAPVFGGNLLSANAFLQDLKTEILTEYLSSKESLQNTPAAPIQGGAAVSQEAPRKPATLSEATDIAMETLKAAGLDTIDW